MILNPSKHKKGYTSTEVFGALIIMILIIIISVQTYNKFVVQGTKVLECTKQGGQCTVGTCNFPSQIPALSDKAAGCGRGELCCLNVTRSEPMDPLCMNAEGNSPLPVGTECEDNMFCDIAQVCVDRCEFCSKNANNMQYNDQVKKICARMTAEAIEKFGKGSSYSCSCTQTECNADRGIKCVEGTIGDPNPSRYCLQTDVNAPDYACCAKGLKIENK